MVKRSVTTTFLFIYGFSLTLLFILTRGKGLSKRLVTTWQDAEVDQIEGTASRLR